ncbi:transposase [Thalassoglobus sp. JC818]|uniref:transposase n=1 Tax=Thalassoglobus sp. JC818 TaxID=3232136 RepID=UPI003457B677
MIHHLLLTKLRRHNQLSHKFVVIDSAQVRALDGGACSGPSPVDRRKRGVKYTLLVDRKVVPLAYQSASAAKAHQTASTGRRKLGEEKGDADNRRRLGRSRGRLTTRFQAATGKSGKLPYFILPAGYVVTPSKVDALGTDRSWRRWRNRCGCCLRFERISPACQGTQCERCTKPHPRRNVKKRCNKTTDQNRNRIERFFGRIKRCRRVATRYEKKAANFASFIWLPALITDPI